MSLVKKVQTRINTLLLRVYEKKNNNHISTSADIINTTLEGNNYVSQKVTLKNCEVGRMTYIAGGSVFKSTKIGRFCSIGPDCKLIRGEHPTREFVSTSPAFFDKKHRSVKSYVKRNKFEDYKFTDTNHKWGLEIGNDVWIASDVLFLEGITIGDGAVIAAGAVVTKDVPPYAVVGGVPAKVIRYRFTSDQIEWLKKFKWWNKDEKWIESHAEYFENIEKFMEQAEKE